MTADPADDIDIAASYSRRDAAAVIPLLDALKARGVRVWFDKNIPGGALWEETITRFMRRAKAVVFFASRASLESDRCFDEVSAARTLKRPIIPVLVEHVNIPDDLPDRLVLTLQTRNTIEAWPGADGDPVEALMRALAGFGVRGTPTLSAEAQPAPAVAAPIAQPVAPAPTPRPAAAPISTAPTPSGPRVWPFAVGGGVLAAAIAAGLFFGGVFGSGKAGGGDASGEMPNFTASEWCSMPAPRMVARAEKQAGADALSKAADAGDMTALGVRCLSANLACTGGGDQSKMAPAFAACQQAGDKGNWRAVFNQGWLKQRGCGVPVDTEGAVAAYSRASDAGCAIAQFYLGTLYQDGELVEYDQAKSIHLLTVSADQNYPPALNRLATAYALGRGVPEDDAKAADMYRRAADLGDVRAMLNYADVLERGTGVPKNTGAAIAYYRRAAEQADDPELKEQAMNALKRLGATSP